MRIGTTHRVSLLHASNPQLQPTTRATARGDASAGAEDAQERSREGSPESSSKTTSQATRRLRLPLLMTPSRTRGVHFAAEPRQRPSRDRAKRALQDLPYNGYLRPRGIHQSDNAHNAVAVAVIEHAERIQLRRRRRSSRAELERAALEALVDRGSGVWDPDAWEEVSRTMG